MIFFKKPGGKLSIALSLLAGVSILASCDGKRATPVNTDATFKIEDKVDVTTASVVASDSFGLPKTKTYNFTACTIDRVLRAPIQYTNFAVSDGISEIPVKSDKNGCLLWSETHDINSASNKVLFKIKRTFIAKERHTGAVVKELAFNPWDDKFYDLSRENPGQSKIIVVDQFSFKISSTAAWATEPESTLQTYLNSIDFTFKDLDYDNYHVNNLLTLEPAHKYLMTLNPSLYQRGLDGKWDSLPVKGGNFSFKMFALKSNDLDQLKPSDIVTVIDEKLTVEKDRSIKKVISLRIKEISQVASRMNVWVRIQALSEEKYEIAPNFYTGVLGPLQGGKSTSIALAWADEKTIQKFNELDGLYKQAHDENLKAKGLDLFAKFSGNKEIKGKSALVNIRELLQDSSNSQFYDLALGIKKHCDREISDYSDFYKAICALAAKPNDIQACVRNYSKYLELKNLTFVDRILNEKPRKIGFHPQWNMRIASNFDFSKSLSKSKSDVTAGSVGVSLGASTPGAISGILGFFGINFGIKANVGRDWLWAISDSQASSKSTSATASESVMVKAVGSTFEIDVQVRNCLLFKEKTSPTGYYACSDKTFPTKTVETYYFINEEVTASPITDPDSDNESRWRMTVRGKEHFTIFEKILAQPNVIFKFDKLSNQIDNQKLPKDFNVNQIFPGLVSFE